MQKKALLIIALIVFFLKLLFLLPFFGTLEHKAQDSLFRLRGKLPISDKIAIVAIDDATFNALNETWPFPRGYHAKLIENLTQAGARQIIFDVEFTELSDPQEDSLLAYSAAQSGKVIFAGKVVYPSKIGEPTQKLMPIPPITTQSIPWGTVNMTADNDGYIRSYSTYEVFDDKPVYSIGIAALANWRVYQPDWDKHIRVERHSLSVADKRIPLESNHKSLINYHGQAGTFPTYSYASVIDDSTFFLPGYQDAELDEFYELLASGAFKDKIVLIGATIDEMHDKFPTPVGGQWMPGVEIHANFIEMALEAKFIKQLNFWLLTLLELLLLTALWFLFRKLKPQWGVLALLLLIIGAFTVAFLLFKSQLLLIPIVQTTLLFILLYLASLIAQYLETLKEKRFIRHAFQQYLAPELVNQLMQNPKSLKYGGELQEISVLFSDIRSFTTYSENHSPQETVNILHEYLTEMVKVIIANQGILDKFVGDEVMALYGTPVPLANHALSACRTALQMREQLRLMQEKWQAEGREPFEIGIGINTGLAVVGNLGSEQIFDYTAIGDTINLGARLEGLNKEYPTPNLIIISEFTLEKVKDFVNAAYIADVKVKGKNKSVKIYELIGLK